MVKILRNSGRFIIYISPNNFANMVYIGPPCLADLENTSLLHFTFIST